MPSAQLERSRRLLSWIAISLALSAGMTSLALAAPGPEEEKAGEDDPAELREQILFGERNAAVRAAIELFLSGKPRFDGKHDGMLKDVLKRSDASVQARTSVLEALGIVGRDRADVACRLARIGLADQDALVRDAAASALAGIERREAYAFLLEALKELTHAPQGSPQSRELDTIVSVLERKHDPISATGVLVDALAGFDGPEEQRLTEALKRLTGRTFATHDEWRRWYDAHKKVPQREWYLEVLRGLEDSNDRAQAAAERLFEKLLASLAKDEAGLLRELEEALSKDSLPAVRASAIKNLGLLGAKPGQTGDRACVLLEEQLKQSPDELTQRAALGALGRTARPQELAVILPYMDNPSRAVRLAAASGLGALRADASIAPLLRALEAGPSPVEKRDPEAAAVLARALGAVGKDPDGRSSSALLSFIARVSSSSSPQARAVAPRPALLQAAAEALGNLGPALARESEAALSVVCALARLAEPQETQDVRWWTATSLGRVPHTRALPALAARLKDEAINVRRAAIGSIGLQARLEGAPDETLRESVALLAEQLGSTEDALKRAGRTELELIVAGDPASFEALTALVESLKKRGEPDLAAPFLDALPAPDKLSEAQKKSLARYWSLLEARAEARLRLSDGRAALADFDHLLAGNAAPPRQRALSLGRARALLASGEMRAASELASRLARAEPKDDDAWACVRSCAEALLSKGERAAARELLGSLEKPLADASPDAQARLQETARRAASEPRKPESEPDKPASPHPGAGP